MTKAPLNNITYLTLPEDFSTNFENFIIDKNIKLPVEIPEGKEIQDSSELSWEMIISAMLKIVAYEPQNEHIEYYRNFVLAVKPNIITELMDSAIEKAKTQNYDLSEEIFTALLGLDPQNNRILLNMAILFENRAIDFEKAKEIELKNDYLEKTALIYQFLFDENEVLPDAYLYGGFFYIKQNSIKHAISCLEAYLNIGSEDEKIKRATKALDELKLRAVSDSTFSVAYNHIMEDEEEKAIQAITEFLSINPEVWNAWFLLGWAQRRLKSYDKALESFQKALELSEPQTDIFNEMSICFLETNQLEKCRETLLIALKLEPENTKIISNFGILSLKEGNISEAQRFFQTVLEYDPQDPLAAQYLEILTS